MRILSLQCMVDLMRLKPSLAITADRRKMLEGRRQGLGDVRAKEPGRTATGWGRRTQFNAENLGFVEHPVNALPRALAQGKANVNGGRASKCL